jgi:hypothetical protein
VIALALGVAACGNVTAGGFSEVSVAVSGDSPDPAPQPAVLAPSVAGATAAPEPALPSSHETEEAEGEVEIDFTLALLSESGEVVALGEDDIRIKLDLQGVEESEVVRELVPVARYTGVRMRFTHIKVEVSGGLVIDGVPIVGEVHVELEDPELVVESAIDIEPTEGSTVEMVVDLNTPRWLAAVDPVTLTIDASVFAGLVDVVVR